MAGSAPEKSMLWGGRFTGKLYTSFNTTKA